jgi:hypothetical protein
MKPTLDTTPDINGPYGEWEAWVRNKLAYDQWQAQQRVHLANGTGRLPSDVRLVAATPEAFAPPAPGMMPERLRQICGDAPPFAEAVSPKTYRVTFDTPDETFAYTDHVRLRDRYAYYRFPEGVVTYGERLSEMPEAERDTLFRLAGFTPSEQRILSAVSRLEGGFETVQTYDTGYVSVGFIQFVSLEDGRADLAHVLYQMKVAMPAEFDAEFRRFGVDVRADRTLTVVDPNTGAELVGKNAVLRVIHDKRLTAVFQRAGRHAPFRVAQIQVAKAYYWCNNDPLTVTLGDGTVLTGTIGEVVQSEAGLATLLDRKINTGNLNGFPAVVQRVMLSRGARTFAEAARYEKEIVKAMTYRANFLADTGLGQPFSPESLLNPFPLPTAFPTPVATPALPTFRPNLFPNVTVTPAAPAPFRPTVSGNPLATESE